MNGCGDFVILCRQFQILSDMLYLHAELLINMYYLLRIIGGIVTLSGLLASTATFANTAPKISEMLSAQKLDCSNFDNLPQQSMNRCAELSYQDADKKLNKVYQQLTAKLEAPRRKKLVVAQQAWIKFRDTSCKFESSEVEGGSIEPLFFSSCLTRLTEQRIKDLKEHR
jgi:uncharacterized protein YecT (DUF1311 family)